MKQVRRGLFETNSSSVHSLTIVPKEDYEAWREGKLIYNYYENKLYTLEKLEKKYRGKCHYRDGNNSCEECLEENGCCEYNFDEIKTFDDYWDSLDFESFEEEYTTKSGDEIVAFGYYGSDY